MNIEKIKQSQTKIIGKTIEYHEQITSTHTYAKGIAKNKNNNGKIIITDVQTQGIGTKGRTWYTGKSKNIAMTIILKPKSEISKLQNHTKTIAICMKQAIFELYNYELTIKEPNDLLLNKKKICGILTEINTTANQINYLLISLGFNVNEEQFSQETSNTATSLKKEYQKEFEREEIISRFIEILENNISEKIEL